MTSAHAVHYEAQLLEHTDNFLSPEPGKPRHTVICWIPTSSRESTSPSLPSRQSSTTSRTRFIKVSRFFA